jgi:hypothetical protein
MPENLIISDAKPHLAFPTPDAGDKKFNSRLVAPIFSASRRKNGAGEQWSRRTGERESRRSRSAVRVKVPFLRSPWSDPLLNLFAVQSKK